jgi:hypothetical protein
MKLPVLGRNQDLGISERIDYDLKEKKGTPRF